MRRTSLTVIAALGLALLAAQLAPGAGAGGKRTCRGLAVTITKNERGERIGGGKDVVIGSNRRDVVNLAGGNDKFYGGGGDDVACAGPGEDLLLGADDDDELFGGGGDDFSRGQAAGGLSNPPRVVGGPGDDELRGGGGNDAINGSSGDDRSFGNGGNDRFDAGSGFDRCDGGRGNDSANASCESQQSIP
ncbi:MAG TPA: hypothetical protein VFH44_04500 [Solirubrobacterales bacterium]|nr:hypothetical protein [Solirubrobacterales bacterium]